MLIFEKLEVTRKLLIHLENIRKAVNSFSARRRGVKEQLSQRE